MRPVHRGVISRTARNARLDQITEYRSVIDPTLVVSPAAGLPVRISMGPVFKLSNVAGEGGGKRAGGRYGAGEFAQVGGAASVLLDVRRRARGTRRRLVMDVGADVFPPLLDVDAAFGQVRGTVTQYLSPRVPLRPTLAARVVGTKVWGHGEVPLSEATIGGGGTLRGFDRRRAAGDVAVLSNVQLRVPLGRMQIPFPTEVGVYGLADAGRRWAARRSTDRWHTAMGGGLWLAPTRRVRAITFSIARSDDRTSYHVRTGFGF